MRLFGIRRLVLVLVAAVPLDAAAQNPPQPTAPVAQPANRDVVFDMGEIVVIGTPDGVPGVGGAAVTRDQVWTFDRNSLDQAVNVVPGVVSTGDANGRRNESDIFVRGFGRWQVPLMMDGVRIYLPADNRLDFSRFLTADIAAVQIQKGYASVIDGPSAMGGAINLVTRKPSKAFDVQGSASLGGRDTNETWSGFLSVGTRQPKYYLQGSANLSERDYWTLPDDYQAPAGSLQPTGRRLSSDSKDSRFNVKAGFTPNDSDEYTINFTRQSGEKGAPLNIFNNPPVPPNSFWRWPWWDVQNTSLLTKTALAASTYLKSKIYYNTFENGLDAYDDITYTTQSANGRFRSPYDDHAYGVSVELGTASSASNTIKTALHYRSDVHTEQNVNRPTHPTLSSTDPLQTRSQYTWSAAVEDTLHVTTAVDLVGGVSYEKYEVTKAESFTAASGLFEFPKGGADSFNWQGAAIWKYAKNAQFHASVSDRSRFPVLFELYSTRFGSATPNPQLGPERATNVELGWKGRPSSHIKLEAAVFYSDVRDLIQTVNLPDTTTQTQNVGDGHFVGGEILVEINAGRTLTFGGNYTAITREITDALQPSFEPTGVPTHKGFLYAAWRPIQRLTITPSIDAASDRWSDRNPPAFSFVQTGAYKLINLSAEYELRPGIGVVAGFKNMTDHYYELAWGLPQPGRTFSVKTRVGF